MSKRKDLGLNSEDLHHRDQRSRDDGFEQSSLNPVPQEPNSGTRSLRVASPAIEGEDQAESASKLEVSRNFAPIRPKDHEARQANHDACGRLFEPFDVSNNSILGRYRIERQLGAGGMGQVFVAHRTDTGETVALKTLLSTNADRLYRFKREFRALADISHPNLVRLYDLVIPAQGPAFFTMELLDGVPFVEWVRGTIPDGELPDINHLEDSLRQLISGIHYLHTHDCVHRDLKPSNVVVTRDGRVVVLDFGLVSEFAEPEMGITQDKQVLGTPGYMAPEQALGRRVGPAADYYAIGIMLFECLTGHRPHQGPPFAQLLAKQMDPTADPGVDIAGIPAKIRTLCMHLLAREPQVRPKGPELLDILRAYSDDHSGVRKVFVGRRGELAELHDALCEVRERRRSVTVHLRGRSGDGKTALGRQFRTELQGAAVTVLHGRCREQETVPYKGVDAVIDALSAYLRRLPRGELEELRPPDLDALTRVFPVLDEIWAQPDHQNIGLTELRNLSGVALRRLLERVTARHPAIIHIDDFQWADLDSVDLLESIVRGPDEPAVLLLLSYRSDMDDSGALQALGKIASFSVPRARMVELGPLPMSDARELARVLMHARGEARAEFVRDRVEAIALRSHGNPLFISQMAFGREDDRVDESNLEMVVQSRIEELAEPAQRLLELVAVYGGPMPYLLARELCEPWSEGVVDSLCERNLLVRDSSDVRAPGGCLEATHDRVRDAVLARLESDDRLQLHRRIGERLLGWYRKASVKEGIFEIVGHLNDGFAELERLTPERRLEFAELNYEAGQRALESTAWIASRRYFQYGYTLVKPWLKEARKGRGHHEICLQIAFGRAQVEFILTEKNRAAIDDVLSWSLSVEDYCRIAQWYVEWQLWKGNFPECAEFGMSALPHVGIRVPRRPTWLGALLRFRKGLSAIRRTGLETIRERSPISDDRVRIGMGILAATSWSAVEFDVKHYLSLSGIYAQLFAQYGVHDGACTALSSLSISAATLGKSSEARALWEFAYGLSEQSGTSVLSQMTSRAVLMTAMPLFRPVREFVEFGERVYGRACEVSPRIQTETIGMLCVNGHLLAGTRLSEILGFIRSIEVRRGGPVLEYLKCLNTIWADFIHTLTMGGSKQSFLGDSFHRLVKLQVPFTDVLKVLQLETDVLLGRRELAWTRAGRLARQYDRKLGPNWHCPTYAMLSAILAADRLAESRTWERWRLRRVIRKRRTTAHRWATQCPQNYQPMLDVIDGELAALENNVDAAVIAYERARAVSAEHGMRWVTGLASERLAKLAGRRGYAILAEGAFDAARDAYDAWGASAVTKRLVAERPAILGR